MDFEPLARYIQGRRRGQMDIDKIIAYEQGDLNEADTIALFQSLVDSGMAWTLQGSYGRTAKALIDAGHVTQGAGHD